MIMAVSRRGERFGFWDPTLGTYNSSTNPQGGVSVPGPGSPSRAIRVGREANSLAVYVRIAATTAFITKFQVQAAHSGGLNDPVTGEPIDQDQQTQTWHDAWYYGMVPTSEPYGTQGATNFQIWIPAGTNQAVMNIVPDWVPDWVRLIRIDTGNAAVTVEAGWEAQSE